MLGSLASAAVLSLTFLFGWQLTRPLGHGGRRLASLSAGVAVAYVFIYMLPELNEAGDVFVEAVRGRALPFPEYRIYSTALIGFVLMYGVEHLRRRGRAAAEGESEAQERALMIRHIVAFAAYALLVGATVGGKGTSGELPLVMYTVAMGLHFVGVAVDLKKEHGEHYLNPGRFILAAAVLAGWVLAQALPESPATESTLLALVSGGVVMNSMLAELPGEKDGRFWPFLIGALGYGLLLLLMARAGVAE